MEAQTDRRVMCTRCGVQYEAPAVRRFEDGSVRCDFCGAHAQAVQPPEPEAHPVAERAQVLLSTLLPH